MAQKQFVTYQADVLSFELKEAMLGIVNPGRVSGFDTITANGTPGANIPILLGHVTGVQKTDNGATALSDPIGVVVSTQGTVIHEDQDIALNPVINSVASVRYDLVYMQHDYVEVIGANPATYGIIQGTAGAGIPTLTGTYHRVPIGYIKLLANANEFSEISWYPAQTEKQYGDHNLAKKLWGSTNMAAYLDPDMIGTIPSEGIIGNRNFNSNYYITDFDSITEALSDLDNALNPESTARIGIGNRAIDSASWGALTDITQGDVNTSRHGLLPKLPNDATKFFNGAGSWVVPSSFNMTLASSGYLAVFSEDNIGWEHNVTESGDIDLSTYIPVGTSSVILWVTVRGYGSALPADGVCVSQLMLSNPDYPTINFLEMNSQQVRFTIDTTPVQIEDDQSGMYIVPVNSARKVHWSFATTSGYGHCIIFLMGYFKPSV